MLERLSPNRQQVGRYNCKVAVIWRSRSDKTLIGGERTISLASFLRVSGDCYSAAELGADDMIWRTSTAKKEVANSCGEYGSWWKDDDW